MRETPVLLSDAVDFFVHSVGVDFHDVDFSEDGFLYKDGWVIQSVIINIGLRIPFSVSLFFLQIYSTQQ